MTKTRLDRFEQERPRLMALAYRMLGERAAAEDVVQEVWLRWSDITGDTIGNPAGWLHTTTMRLAIDALRSARHRREVYVGPWLPEPLVRDASASSEDHLSLAQDCELALLWAMERLTPEERAAFVLKQVFDADYEELAQVLDKSEAACRQLVSRAGKKVKSAGPRFKVEPQETATMLARFSQAVAAQDRATVLSLMSADVTAISDGGGKVRAAFRPLAGRDEVAQVLLSIASKQVGRVDVRTVRANGAPALAVLDGGADDMVFTLTVNRDGLIDWIYIMRNPEKLPHRPPLPGVAH